MDPEFVKKFSRKLDESIEKVRATRMEDERRRLMSTIGQDLAKLLQPFLSEMASSAKMNKGELRDAMYEALGALNAREVNIDTAPIIGAIEAAFMNIQLPEPKVTVNIPEMKVPEMKMPDEMNVRGFHELMGIFRDTNNPIPVQLRDHKGNPVKMFDNLTQILAGGGGGKADFFTIKGFSQSAFAELQNPDGRIKVELPTSGGGLTDAELRASSVPVSQASGAVWSTNVVDAFGSTAVGSVFNADNRLRVSVETGGSGLTDAELRASAVPVSQLSGAIWSTAVIDIFGSAAAASVFNADNRIRVSVETGGSGLTDSELRASSVPVEQVSGSIWSVFATNPVNQGDAATALRVVIAGNSDASVAASQVGTWTITSITNSVAASLVDSSGVQYSGSNPVPIGDAGGSITIDGTVAVSGSITSTVATGPTVADAVDDGSAPVQQGGIARTANPTAVAGGDVVKSSHDDLGRTLTRPVQVRDLTVTAYVSLSNGTETTLLAASAGSFHDLVYVMAANNSDAAVTLDIRPVTAGNIVMSIQVPANGTAGVACPVPYPQSASDTGNNWTVDMADITGTTVYISALFSREV